MSESQALAFTQLMFAQAVSILTYRLAFLMTYINGPLSSAIASTRPKNCLLTTGSGRDGPKVSELYLRLMLSITPSRASCSEDQGYHGT